ncbi:ABC transporter substrate-binding protein [Microvirga zambiensis]|uniref:ABC transporter substrate-binding protein n=1 Tax=Microvirga zambiensis TaxID=1402137 RepID=UPI00191E2465|nr:ABC transporter substrate-binding protein [Microvirga zambiensis]
MVGFGSAAVSTRMAGLALCLSSAFLCAPGVAAAQDKPQAGGTLRVVTYEPLCLDQIEGTSRNTQTALQSIYDRLVSESLDGKFHSWLASEWAISEDQLTYAFTIRDGVTFHDGTPLNAEAVRFNLQRWLDVKKAGSAPVESISSKDNVVTVKLRKAYSPFLHDLSEPTLGFISPASIQKYSKEERCAGGPGVTAGSGPFKVASRTPGRDLVLERNDNYNWAPADAAHQGKAYLDRVELRFLKEDSVRVGAVESNQADIATGVPAISVEDIKSKPHLKLLQTQQPGIPWSFWLNQSKSPLDDVRVREALRVGADYAGLIDAVFLGTATPAYAALTPAVALGHDPSLEKSWTFDEKKAKALLDEAGWSKTDSQGFRVKDGKRLTLRGISATPWSNQQRDLYAQGLKAAFAAIGVDYVRDVIDFGSADARFKANDYDIVDTSQAAGEPNLLYGAFYSTETWDKNTNWGFVKDKDLDGALADGLATTDREKRIAAYTAAQKIIAEKVYLIPIANPTVLLAVNKKVQGVTFGTSGQIGSYYDVWLSK